MNNNIYILFIVIPTYSNPYEYYIIMLFATATPN